MNLIRILLQAASKLQIASPSNTVDRPRSILKSVLRNSLSLSLCFLSGSVRAQGQIIHESYSPEDQWEECIRHVTGKPLLLTAWRVGQPFECPSSLGDLKLKLGDNRVLISGEKWDLLFGKNYLVPGETPPEFWRSVFVKIGFRSWEQEIPGSRHPTDAELQVLGEKALKVIRSSIRVVAPIAPKREPGTEQSGDTTATLNLELLFDIHRLSQNGPESIIGIFRQSGGGAVDGRVIYGEYRNGNPAFLWDSPMIVGISALAYRDVKGYGAQDIALKAEPSCGNRSCEEALIVFTNRGEELTRQWLGRPVDSCVEGYACPIMGGEFHFIHQGTQVPERIEVEWTENHQPNDIYLLDSSNTFRKQPRPASQVPRKN
jgi:hypothetical protein